MCNSSINSCGTPSNFRLPPPLSISAVEEYYGPITHTSNTDWILTQVTESGSPPLNPPFFVKNCAISVVAFVLYDTVNT
jgi:hypothetical protein